MENQTQELEPDRCSILRAYTRTFPFMTVLLAQAVLSLAAMLLNLVLCVLLWRVKIFHLNLRLLLTHISISQIGNSLGFGMKAIELLLVAFSNDYCGVTMSIRQCGPDLVGWILTVAMPLAVYTELMLCIERLVSSVWNVGYDSSKCSYVLGVLLVPGAYVMPVVNNFILLGGQLDFPPPRMPDVCEGILMMTPKSSGIIIALDVFSMLAIMLCTLIVHYLNTHKLRAIASNRARHSLAVRFQIEQNLKVNRIIVPDIYTAIICFIPNYVVFILVLAQIQAAESTLLLLVYFGSVWRAAHGIVHPIMAVKRNDHLRQRLINMLPGWSLKCVRQSVQNGLHIKTRHGRDGDAHFKVLDELWARKSRNSRGSTSMFGMKRCV